MNTHPPKTRAPRAVNGVLELPAITLWQPWASLLVCGLKAHETRSWPHHWQDAPTVVAVHAAKRSPTPDTLRALADDAIDDLDVIRALMGPHPLGAMVGLVVFDRPRRMNALGNGVVWCPQGPIERALGDWRPGRYAWLALASCAFETPVRAGGHQGAWKWSVPASIASSVESAAERLAECANLRTSDEDWLWVESTWPATPPWDIDRSRFDPWRKQ